MKSALVVISHYNAWPADQLVALLDQLREVPSGYPFRCRVVVNQAVDRLLELPTRHADVEILHRENTGYNIGAWDHGWRAGPPADDYLFLQEECKILRPDWLGSFVRRLAKPKVGLVGESLAWPGLSWARLAYLQRFYFYEGKPDEPVLRMIDGVRSYLGSRGIPVGATGDHLQSLIVAARRDVLESVGGFLIGDSKGNAISCEVGFSRAVASKGLRIEQVGLLPFHYVGHPQWEHRHLGLFWLPICWAERFAPAPTVEAAKRAIFRVRQILTGEAPKHWVAGQGTDPA